MVIQTVCSVALYCQRCGKVHVHDVPYFAGTRRLVLRCDSCAHEQAVLVRCRAHKIELRIACAVCDRVNTMVYSLRRLHRLQLEKIYCQKDHFELGYIGRRRRIEELLTFNQAEFAALHPGEDKDQAEKQRVLLAAMNCLHDIAAAGDLLCSCGSSDISADIRGSSIVLTCGHCGSYCLLPAEHAEDLAKLRRLDEFVFVLPDLRKKH